MASASVVVVTLNALPWLAQCLGSVLSHETIVVDHGSTDGTLELVRQRADIRLIEEANIGMGAGNNTGIRAAAGDYVLVLNPDAWALGDSLERLVAYAEEHPEAAVVGPRLLNPDGTLQRSVRGFPTLWRLATEYFFLRKLAPRTGALNAFYAGGFDHDEAREVDWVMGACMLVRRRAFEEVGLFDEEFFLFSEETDWCYRFRQAGWKVLFYPGAEFVHVGGATHGGLMYVENLRGHLRFFSKHYGRRQASRARRLLIVGVTLRGRLFAGDRGRIYREAARWLRSRPAAALLERR